MISRQLLDLALGIALFLLIDASLFRTGLYDHIIEPQSFSGSFGYLKKFESNRKPPPGIRDVLVMGDSRMGEGFSAIRANAALPESDVQFINASMPSSSLRVWYYFLRAVDPNRNRYAAVIIPFPEYADGEYYPTPASYERISLDLKLIGVELKFSDIPDLLTDQDSLYGKVRVLRDAFLKGFIFKNDLGDLLLHPIKRIQEVSARNLLGQDRMRGKDGRDKTLEGLRVVNNQLVVSKSLPLDAATEEQIRWVLGPSSVEYPNFTGRYRTKWLGKILACYRDSSTKVIAIRVPASPVGKYLPTSSRKQESLLRLSREWGNKLVILPDTSFTSLEIPKNFWDGFHMNHNGLIAFSPALARLTSKVLSENSSEAANAF